MDRLEVESRASWIPQDAMLKISHVVRKDGAPSCNNCHFANGVMNFEALGYDELDAASLMEEHF